MGFQTAPLESFKFGSPQIWIRSHKLIIEKRLCSRNFQCFPCSFRQLASSIYVAFYVCVYECQKKSRYETVLAYTVLCTCVHIASNIWRWECTETEYHWGPGLCCHPHNDLCGAFSQRKQSRDQSRPHNTSELLPQFSVIISTRKMFIDGPCREW